MVNAKQIVEKIKALGIYQDAVNCKNDNDFSGLVYIVNIAENRPGSTEMTFKDIFAILEEIK